MVEWIEYSRLHLYLQAHSPFSNTSSNLVVAVRWLINQAVCSAVESLSEAVANRLITRSSLFGWRRDFFVVFSRRISVCSRVSCSKVVDVSSTMHRLLVLLGFPLRMRVIFCLWRLRRGWVSFYVIDYLSTLATLRVAFRRHPKRHSIILEVRTPRKWFAIFFERQYDFHQLYWRIEDTLLRLLQSVLVLRWKKLAMAQWTTLSLSSSFDNP